MGGGGEAGYRLRAHCGQIELDQPVASLDHLPDEAGVLAGGGGEMGAGTFKGSSPGVLRIPPFWGEESHPVWRRAGRVLEARRSVQFSVLIG